MSHGSHGSHGRGWPGHLSCSSSLAALVPLNCCDLWISHFILSALLLPGHPDFSESELRGVAALLGHWASPLSHCMESGFGATSASLRVWVVFREHLSSQPPDCFVTKLSCRCTIIIIIVVWCTLRVSLTCKTALAT